MFETLQKPYRVFLLVMIFVAGLLRASAQADVEKLRFELLTCSPGQEVYELYGHTALRATDGETLDVVFNYGVFNFQKPHFLWNFVLGRTDYMVQPIPFDLFLQEYQERGSSVTAQQLNLTVEESGSLMRALMENCLPMNREYRYNYLSNNCTTRVRDMIEQAIGGEVRYDERKKLTYRESIHLYTKEHPWAELGNDMLLGASVDTVLTDRNSAFLPERLMHFYDEAIVYDAEGNSRQLLVGKSRQLVPLRHVAVEPEFPLTPLEVVFCFAGLCLLVFLCELIFKRMIWGFDAILMLAQGLSGVLLWFMFFFSEHPAVDSNWQIWLFNPFPMLCMPWVVWSAVKRRFCVYHLVNMAVLVLFLAFSPWIPQSFALFTIPLACCLLLRPLSYNIYYKRVLPKLQQPQEADAKHEPTKPKKKTRK